MNIETINGESVQVGRYLYQNLLFIEPAPNPELVDKLNTLAASEGCWYVQFSSYISIDYDGEDTERRTLEFLMRAAPLVGNTIGEIMCFLFPNDFDDTRIFVEFLTIRKGKLRRQCAKVKRKHKSEVVTQKIVDRVIAHDKK